MSGPVLQATDSQGGDAPDTESVRRVASIAPVAAVVLTHNEEKNLPDCLASLAGWVQQIFVVDSGSSDRTVGIAGEAGATVLEHPFAH